MRWNIIKDKIPPSGVDCIVGRVVDGSPSYGIYTYFYSSEPYWYSQSNGIKVKVLEYDHWYYVDDLIEHVKDMIIEDIKSTINERNSLHIFE